MAVEIFVFEIGCPKGTRYGLPNRNMKLGGLVCIYGESGNLVVN